MPSPIWYRSRHTGRYFLFGVGYVERINSRRWQAGLLFGLRQPIREFPNMREAREWVEEQRPQAKSE